MPFVRSRTHATRFKRLPHRNVFLLKTFFIPCNSVSLTEYNKAPAQRQHEITFDSNNKLLMATLCLRLSISWLNLQFSEFCHESWNCKKNYVVIRDVARNLLRGTKEGVWGRGQKSLSGVQGQSPGVGLGWKPPEAGDMLNILLNKIHKKINTAKIVYFEKISSYVGGGGTCTHVPSWLHHWSSYCTTDNSLSQITTKQKPV